jgi:hypothetical protein
MAKVWNDTERAELANLFHLARTALAGANPTRYDCKCWAATEYEKEHPEVSSNSAYKELCRQEAWRRV